MLNYVKFIPAGEENKSTLWRIHLPGVDGHVGYVRWHDKAEKYVFFPEPHVWLDWSGLRMVAEFCEKKTQLKKMAVV